MLKFLAQTIGNPSELVCPLYEDQGAVQGIIVILIISSLIVLLSALLSYLVRRRGLKTKVHPVVWLVVAVLLFNSPRLHQTDNCGHGGLFVDLSDANILGNLIAILFLVAMVLTVGSIIRYICLLTRSSSSKPGLKK